MKTTNIEKDYLSKQIPYRNEQYILGSFLKEGLQQEIYEMEKIYKIKREKLLNEYKERISNDDYINGSEMDKYFIKMCFHTFEEGTELNLYKDLINKFKMYYKIHYTDLYKGNSYVSFDINSTKIKDVIGIYMKVPENIRRNIHCPLHEEKSASFRIYENTNSYFCYGCHKGGGPVNFIADVEGITTKKAFKKLITLYS